VRIVLVFLVNTLGLLAETSWFFMPPVNGGMAFHAACQWRYGVMRWLPAGILVVYLCVLSQHGYAKHSIRDAKHAAAIRNLCCLGQHCAKLL